MTATVAPSVPRARVAPWRSAATTLTAAALALAAGAPAHAGSGPAEDGNAGLDALGKGDYETAIKMFTRVLKSPGLSPSDKELAYSQRGIAHLKHGDSKLAVADLQKALALKPDDQEAQSALDQAKAGGAQTAEAAAPSRGGAGRSSPGRAQDDANAAMKALERNDYALAVRLFSRALDSGGLSQEDAEFALVSRGKAYLGEGAGSAAVLDFDRALHIKSDDQEAQTGLGQALSSLHARTAQTPVDLATCSAAYSSSGNFLSGKTYKVSAVYPALPPVDAVAGAYAYLLANQWDVSAVDVSGGTIAASHGVPAAVRVAAPTINVPFFGSQQIPVAGGGKGYAIRVQVEPSGAGSKTTLTETVAGMQVSIDVKGALCGFLAEVPKG
jgi:tetratricopeptide (TPR) repeat protein